MKKVKNVRIKPGFARILKFVGSILCVLLGIFIFYRMQISRLLDLDYSYTASRRILFTRNKDYVLSVGKNRTLNMAFESSEYNPKYLENYAKIKYVNHKNLIHNINKLLKIGYSNSDINMIITHGSDQDVEDFLKKGKVKYLEEFYTISYAKISNYDRYVAYSDETGEDAEDVIIVVNLDLDKEDYVDASEVKKFSYDMLVNKHRYLSEKFEPDNLVKIGSKYASDDDLKCSKVALDAYIKMYKDAKKDGLDLIINSAYRSFQDQEEIENTYRDIYGQEYVNKYIAKAGYSEHQTGLSFDIGSKNSKVFAQSKEYQWVQDNAYKYGFIYRYDKRYEDLTGFRSEAWHYRYVGKEIAKYIFEHNNMSLEEYYVIFLDK